MKWAILILTAFFTIMFSFGLAAAGDQIIDSEITAVSEHIDKNGAAYTRIIINEKRNKNGIEYTKTVPVMCFGQFSNPCSTYKAGEKLQAIADYDASYDSYSVVKLIQD